MPFFRFCGPRQSLEWRNLTIREPGAKDQVPIRGIRYQVSGVRYCLRMKMRLNSLEEVERWVLSFAARAKVIGPPALVERVKRSLAETAALYEDKS